MTPCWLKWGRGDVVVNANVKSALLSFSVPQYCQLQSDLDYVDNDLTRVDGAKAEDCCDKCQKYAGCRAYSWSDYQGGSCWLKSKVTQTVYKQGVKSASAYPGQGNSHLCPYLEYDIDYVDNDISNHPDAVADLCCDFCKVTNGCKAWSWSSHNGGTCWLKAYKGVAVSPWMAFSWSDHNRGTCWRKSGKGTPVGKSGVNSATV